LGVLLAAAGLGACSDDRRAENLEFRLKISEQQAADLDTLLEQTRKELREASEARLKAEWENRKRTEDTISEVRVALSSLEENRTEAIKAEQGIEKITAFIKELSREWAEKRRVATAELNELAEGFRGDRYMGYIEDYEEVRELLETELERLTKEVDRLRHENRALKARQRK
jgi:hypothetical protein